MIFIYFDTYDDLRDIFLCSDNNYCSFTYAIYYYNHKDGGQCHVYTNYFNL